MGPVSMFDVHDLIELFTVAGWVLVDLTLAILAFYRFRGTPAGILMGASFALMSLKNLLSSMIWHLYLNRAYDFGWAGSYEAIDLQRNLYFLTRTGLSWLLMLLLAVGVVLIPYSLGRLRRPLT